MATYLLGALLLAGLCLALRHVYRNLAHGASDCHGASGSSDCGCGGGCAGCQMRK